MKSKKLYLSIEITQLLNKYNCTFSKSETIIKLISDYWKQKREELEYETLDDYFSQHKTDCVDNKIIIPMNHVEGYF